MSAALLTVILAPVLVCSGQRIFITSNYYSMNLGGISGADAICASEAGVPAKALLVDEGGCGGEPCRRGTPLAQVDWPLLPNTDYYNFDMSAKVATTTCVGLLPSSLESPIRITESFCRNQASGFERSWATKVGKTCNDWTSNSENDTVALGWVCGSEPDGLNTGFVLDGGNGRCSDPAQFLCATTPDIAFTPCGSTDATTTLSEGEDDPGTATASPGAQDDTVMIVVIVVAVSGVCCMAAVFVAAWRHGKCFERASYVERLKTIPRSGELQSRPGPEHPENWGLSVSQLVDFYDEFRGRLESYCQAHGNVPLNMHIVVKCVIKPETLAYHNGERGYALMINEDAPKKCQTFISHCWNEAFKDFVRTLEKNLDRDCAVWICSFALPQNMDIGAALDGDLIDSPFAQALLRSEDVLLAVDEAAEPLTRVWCIYEMYLASMSGIHLDIGTPEVNAYSVLEQKTANLNVRFAKASSKKDEDRILSTIKGHEDQVNKDIKFQINRIARKIKQVQDGPTSLRISSMDA
mmetsp:Transcript_72411/g.169591  ORF Transcript_72411/g.169591 Transcript_72411/m.169591 type:complete len:523 (-) Transcript_72411:113-1681(-)